MANNEQLVKFIIKSIVSDVEYDVSGDKFTINRIDISDDLIDGIIAEGAKYGLNADDTRELITLVSSDIQIAPSVHRSYTNTEISEIKTGSHLRLNFIHDKIGPVYIEIICLEIGRFFIVSTNVSGLRYHDEIISINKVWNISYDIDFIIYRQGKVYPDKQSALRLNKLQSIEYFHPSVIHEIFDSQKHFTKEELDEETFDTPNNGIITQYVWTPKRHNPIAFSLSEQETDPKSEAVFLIKRRGVNSTTAKISINPQLNLPQDEHQRQYLVDTITECCDINEKHSANFILPMFFKSIKTIKAGKLHKENNIKGSDLWTLVEKPIIKIVR